MRTPRNAALLIETPAVLGRLRKVEGSMKTKRIAQQAAMGATLHSLSGCVVGEMGGNIIGAFAGWNDMATITASVALAFAITYIISTYSLMRVGVGILLALPLAIATDSLSIMAIELITNLVFSLVPGALDAGVASLLFWLSVGLAVVLAYVIALPIHYVIIRHGQGRLFIRGRRTHRLYDKQW